MSADYEAEYADAAAADRWARAHYMDADRYDRAVDAHNRTLREMTGEAGR